MSLGNCKNERTLCFVGFYAYLFLKICSPAVCTFSYFFLLVFEEIWCLRFFFSCEKINTNFAFTEKKPKQVDNLEETELIVLKRSCYELILMAEELELST